jgi:hypothetical protein
VIRDAMRQSPEAVSSYHPEEGTGEEHKDTGDTRKLEHQIAQDLLAMEKKAAARLVTSSHPVVASTRRGRCNESIATLQGVPGEPLDGSQEGVRVCTVPQAARGARLSACNRCSTAGIAPKNVTSATGRQVTRMCVSPREEEEQ